MAAPIEIQKNSFYRKHVITSAGAVELLPSLTDSALTSAYGTSKYDVKGDNAHPIYIWAKETFGKSTVPKWNFHKILINKEGKVEDTFASFTNPMSKKIINKLEEIL